MTDLRAFIEARLAEDEQGARNARDPDWRPDGANSCQVYTDRADDSNRTIAWCRNGHDDDFANSLHIARHDPARVLREVAAKRATLAAHPRANDPGEPPHCETCRYVADPSDPEPFPEAGYPCPTVRLLAAPFADHPDYRASWAPETVTPTP